MRRSITVKPAAAGGASKPVAGLGERRLSGGLRLLTGLQDHLGAQLERQLP
jgi:hypothetical protein